MEISIFGYKTDLEILILIGVVYLILAVNTVCSCSNIPKIMETMKTLSSSKGISINVTK